jgi:hypothetical protein
MTYSNRLTFLSALDKFRLSYLNSFLCIFMPDSSCDL